MLRAAGEDQDCCGKGQAHRGWGASPQSVCPSLTVSAVSINEEAELGGFFSLTHSQALTKSGAGAVSHGTQANSSKLFCKFITALAPQKCERGQDHSGFVLFLSYIQVFTSPEGFAVLAGLCDVKC